MEFRMTVEMDNAAFEDAPGSELCRLLTILDNTIKREGARVLANGGVRLRDSNGNTVGVAKVVRD